MSGVAEDSHLQSNKKITGDQRRTGSGNRDSDQQPGSSAYALFRVGHFGDIECALCFFGSISTCYTWNLDVYFSGTSDLITDDHAEKIRGTVFIQFCCGICIQ